jgi:small subunit ribosomal protein MRP21
MGSRSLGELLLRPSPLARTQFFPTASIRRGAPSCTARRSITNTPGQPAAQPNRKDDYSDYDYEPRHPAVRRPPRRSLNSETSQAIDDLFSGTPRSQAPFSRPGTSGDEVRTARQNHVFGAEFSSPNVARRPTLNFDDMLPSEIDDPNFSNKPSEAASLATQQAEAFANYPRLNPTYGRAVELDPSRGRDIVRGISMLGSLVARNKVKSDVMKQRFHERGGLKRKRLNSERWRARFKTGFRDITARVSELTRKGW